MELALQLICFLFIERFHSRGYHLCKFIGTKERVCIRKDFNSQRIGLGHQHGRRFIVLGHQYGGRDVMWKRSIGPHFLAFLTTLLLNTSKNLVISNCPVQLCMKLQKWYHVKHFISEKKISTPQQMLLLISMPKHTSWSYWKSHIQANNILQWCNHTQNKLLSRFPLVKPQKTNTFEIRMDLERTHELV